MELNKLSAQISVFLQDGIFNPSKYKKKIDKVFDDLFDVEVFSMSVDGAPDDMPLVRCDSSDGTLSYDFSRKRINFYINFLLKKEKISFDDYKKKIYKFIKEELSIDVEISRIGIAFMYYINVEDQKNDFWLKKYSFPLTTSNTSQLMYTVNNMVEKDKVKYNNIISLSNAGINNKNYPAVSVDFNNIPVSILTEKQIEFILLENDSYEINSVIELLK